MTWFCSSQEVVSFLHLIPVRIAISHPGTFRNQIKAGVIKIGMVRVGCCRKNITWTGTEMGVVWVGSKPFFQISWFYDLLLGVNRLLTTLKIWWLMEWKILESRVFCLAVWQAVGIGSPGAWHGATASSASPPRSCTGPGMPSRCGGEMSRIWMERFGVCGSALLFASAVTCLQLNFPSVTGGIFSRCIFTEAA